MTVRRLCSWLHRNACEGANNADPHSSGICKDSGEVVGESFMKWSKHCYCDTKPDPHTFEVRSWQVGTIAQAADHAVNAVALAAQRAASLQNGGAQALRAPVA